MIATPLDIGGANRDIIAGLDMNDSLCVVATSGAIRLEQQFTGAGLIVPQSGEFFLLGGKFGSGGGHAWRLRMHADARASLPPPQIPVMGVTSRDHLNVEQYPSEAAPRRRRHRKPAPPARLPRSSLRPNRMCSRGFWRARTIRIRLCLQPKETAPPAPVVSVPEYQDYSAAAGVFGFDLCLHRRRIRDIGAVLLVRNVHVEPDYQFTGHVEAPHLETVAVAQKSSSLPGKQGAGEGNSSGGKKEGFWTRLKRAFGGVVKKI